MKHDYLNNTPLDEAKQIFLSAVSAAGFTAPTEVIPAARSAGRITASAVYAAISAPHYNASAMDGVAVKAEKTFCAGENAPVFLTADDYTVVDTGDAMPDGTDAVIMIEDVHEERGGVIKILSGIVRPDDGELVYVPDICVVCGEYAGEGSHICPRCKKKIKDEGLL